MADNNLVTTDEVLLLENLMYLTNNSPLSAITECEGKTVEWMLSKIDVNKLSDDKNYGSYITGEDWKQLINAIKSNENLMNMRIATTNVDNSDGGGGGVSAVFVNEKSGEAVVAFRGTAGNEWKDNFIGGGPTGDSVDGVSTVQQRNALEWYQEIYNELGLDDYTVTVTGHSKGGNKAKYITILDGTVDRCISFDGQGFSDEFYEEYAIEIAAREGNIENHNVNYDFVNLLLNDVGNTTYYQGFDYGSGGFVENHCPNTFFRFDEQGNYLLTPVEGQPEEMQQLDAFLNSYLRSMPKEDKVEALELIGQLVEQFFAAGEISIDDINAIINDLASDPECEKTLSHLLAYVIEYGQVNPEFWDSISGIMDEIGIGDSMRYVEMVEGIINWEYFDLLYDIINGVANIAPDFIWEKLSEYIKEKSGIELSKEEMEKLINIIGMVNDNMDSIRIDRNSGRDKTIGDAFGACRFSVQIRGMIQESERLQEYANRMREQANRVDNVKKRMDFTDFGVKFILSNTENSIERDLQICNRMAEVLLQMVEKYRTTEASITLQ